MTGFAGHIDFAPGRIEAVGLERVILLQVCGVTLGAHVIPVLLAPGPVQHVGMRYFLVGIKVIPTLIDYIPGDRQRLQSPIAEADQVLLKWRHAEGVGDAKFL